LTSSIPGWSMCEAKPSHVVYPCLDSPSLLLNLVVTTVLILTLPSKKSSHALPSLPSHRHRQ
jgi:hypothetical protein